MGDRERRDRLPSRRSAIASVAALLNRPWVPFAVLIGAAGQIAKMFLAGSTTDAGATQCTASVLVHALHFNA